MLTKPVILEKSQPEASAEAPGCTALNDSGSGTEASIQSFEFVNLTGSKEHDKKRIALIRKHVIQEISKRKEQERNLPTDPGVLCPSNTARDGPVMQKFRLSAGELKKWQRSRDLKSKGSRKKCLSRTFDSGANCSSLVNQGSYGLEECQHEESEREGQLGAEIWTSEGVYNPFTPSLTAAVQDRRSRFSGRGEAMRFKGQSCCNAEAGDNRTPSNGFYSSQQLKDSWSGIPCMGNILTVPRDSLAATAVDTMDPFQTLPIQASHRTNTLLCQCKPRYHIPLLVGACADAQCNPCIMILPPPYFLPLNSECMNMNADIYTPRSPLACEYLLPNDERAKKLACALHTRSCSVLCRPQSRCG